MMESFVEKNFGDAALAVIDAANAILEEYAAQGFDLTLRQLYYQFVARQPLAEPFPNNQKSYKRLGSIVNDARMAGMIDWDRLVDRTRNLVRRSTWDDPSDILKTVVSSYRTDIWASQPYYVEAWIEKDALVGVLQPPCEKARIPYFSCRGYTSQSEMYSAAQRLLKQIGEGKTARILHLGDHDPSGIDMSRDIEDRIRLFLREDEVNFEITRLALTMAQVEELQPPPNPAKLTDSRVGGYLKKYGNQSWELDALDPPYIATLIRNAVAEVVDQDAWDATEAAEKTQRHALSLCAKNWPAVEKRLLKEDSK